MSAATAVSDIGIQASPLPVRHAGVQWRIVLQTAVCVIPGMALLAMGSPVSGARLCVALTGCLLLWHFVTGNRYHYMAVALGTLQDRPETTLAMKSMGHWTSIYTLNPVLPAGFLRALARRAGVHIYNDRDDTLYASRSYLTLAANLAGRRRIQLPRRADVFGPFTGDRLWHGVPAFERDFQAKETVIWRLA